MLELDFEALWERLINSDETVTIEAKKASEAGKSLWETISAFANEPNLGGGYLLLGVTRIDDSEDYQITGIDNPDKIQSDIATQCCESFNLPIRPSIEVHTTPEGKNVIVVYIPEVQPHDKPVYIKSKGLPKGAYRRIGSTDQKCTEEDLALFYQLRNRRTYDETPISDTSIEDLDPRAIAEYRRIRKDANPNASELSYDNADLLYSLNSTTKFQGQICATIAGLLLFGKPAALRRYFPMCRVDYISVEGRTWIPDPDKRYQTIEVLEPLLIAIPKLINLVINDIPKAFSLPDNSIYRQDIPLIPRNVIREAIVNALMHRNYRKNQPIQIIRFSNRIEILNGGYSLKPYDQLGQAGSVTRNEKIAAVLHDLNIAETKGTGVRVMIDAMQKANLSIPIFESSREQDNFTIKLLTHHFLSDEDLQWLSHFKAYNLSDDEAKALIVTRELGTINNLTYRHINCVDTLAASRRLTHLRDLGLLQQEGKGSATHYILPTNVVEELSEEFTPQITTVDSSDRELSEESTAQIMPTNSSDTDFAQNNLRQLPEKLKQAIANVGQRTSPEKMKALILQLCEWQALEASDLAELLHRDQSYLREEYLSKMVRNGELDYVYPQPNSPKQAYKSKTN
ncbi:putative DNA binding domain-containing protein [Pseudanabaena sp. FACHB-1998]|uniref:RNA-binding domain-containing protein n=1 Tax=Pseudanabaena sp. FACHB-1998 TaxID=2692858 RepID=UPI001680392F|nr:RNA-binding domain-containing protein [Pseudanabaena sp. FACHB-1998]MBD2175840.1 putative DNA binding domain-containing protein [Pseudanabaena sp. FACHB-1998]